MQTSLKILDYDPAHQPWFEKLNRQWIERYFSMEPLDFEILRDPEAHIIGPGGAVFLATWNEEPAGTVALKYAGPGVYELTKMAVDDRFQGKKIGRALAEAAIHRAKEKGAQKIFLYSNTMLKPAIALYRKLGFTEVPVDGPYRRTDIKMELGLTKSSSW